MMNKRGELNYQIICISAFIQSFILNNCHPILNKDITNVEFLIKLTENLFLKMNFIQQLFIFNIIIHNCKKNN
jgi:hypothetical protein